MVGWNISAILSCLSHCQVYMYILNMTRNQVKSFILLGTAGAKNYRHRWPVQRKRNHRYSGPLQTNSSALGFSYGRRAILRICTVSINTCTLASTSKQSSHSTITFWSIEVSQALHINLLTNSHLQIRCSRVFCFLLVKTTVFWPSLGDFLGSLFYKIWHPIVKSTPWKNLTLVQTSNIKVQSFFHFKIVYNKLMNMPTVFEVKDKVPLPFNQIFYRQLDEEYWSRMMRICFLYLGILIL